MSDDINLRQAGVLFGSVLLAKVPEIDYSMIITSAEGIERIKSEMIKFVMGTQMKLKQRVDAQDELMADIMPEIETMLKESA